MCAFVLGENVSREELPHVSPGVSPDRVVIVNAISQRSDDRIHIEELEITARVGVPEEERAEPQRLVVSITLWPLNTFDDLEDDLAKTVNYSRLWKNVRQFAEARRDKLIETLALAIAHHLLRSFALQAVRIELRKFVIPKADYVAVIITRRREDLPGES